VARNRNIVVLPQRWWDKALRRTRGSLSAKIIARSFVPTAIILVVVALVTFTAYQKVAGDLVIQRNRELVRLSASQLAATLAEYADLLAGMARSADIYRSDPAAQRDALKGASNHLAVFDAGVLLLDTFGTVVASEPERPEALGKDWSDRACYRELLRSQTLVSSKPVFSGLVADGPQSTEVVCVAVPINGERGEFLGAMVGMFRLGATAVSTFYGNIVKLRIGDRGTVYLVDDQGRAIYHSIPARIGEDASAQKVVQRVLSGQVNAVRTRDLDGHKIVASFAPVPGTSWGLVTEENWATLTSASSPYRRSLLVLLVLGVVVPALVVAVGIGRITRPIGELISAAQRVAQGQFGQTISARTGDEIEELAAQFNLMAAQLEESYSSLEQRVADRTRELATLNAIAITVSQSLDLDEVLNDALDKTLQVMGIESGGIYFLDDKTDELLVAVHRGFSPAFVAEIDRLKIGEGFSGRVVQSGQPLVVRDISIDPRLTRMAAREQGHRSLAAVPLSCKGQVLGTLFAVTRAYRAFSDQDVQLLTSIGHQIGVAVENARFFQAEQRRAEQFRVIGEVGRQITSILDIDEVLVQVVRSIHNAFGYDVVSIALIEGDEAVYKVGAGYLWEDPDTALRSIRPKVGKEGITGWVAARGEPLLVPDVHAEPRYVWTRGSHTRSELAVPIQVKGQVVGVLDVQSDLPNAFDESDIIVLQSLASQAGVAIENARLYEDAQQAAVMEERNRLARELHDAVTQNLFSSSLIAETLPALWESDQEEGRQFLQKLRQLSRGAMAEMRGLLLELRPTALVEARLSDLLRQLGEAVAGRTDEMSVKVLADDECPLPADVHVALYRIAQEALNNVVKHANASQVDVSLRCMAGISSQGEEKGMRVELGIRDDGCGFDPDHVRTDHLGLGIMRERAQAVGAHFEVESQPECGTRVMVVWPQSG
jgi:nitrate/nitrite-specific signal transduction histidine kinase